MMRVYYRYSSYHCRTLFSVFITGVFMSSNKTYAILNMSQNQNTIFSSKINGGLIKWANNFPALKQQDKTINNNIKLQKKYVANIANDTDVATIDQFQQLVAFPLQTSCPVGKWMGLSRWHPKCGSTDGAQYICLANIYKDILKGKCIVYSFGINDNIEFESEMGRIGCKVWAYDPTIHISKYPGKNIHFMKTGMGHYTGLMTLKNSIYQTKFPVLALQDAIKNNNHSDFEISLLKVDIEGSEVKAIGEWFASGVLKQVRQIAVELHTGSIFFKKAKRPSLTRILTSFLTKFHKLGFKLVYYSPNTCVGKEQDPFGKKYYTFMDIVLYKP